MTELGVDLYIIRHARNVKYPLHDMSIIRNDISYAEPALSALITLAALVHPERQPYLYFLLHQWAEVLVLTIGLGMGRARNDVKSERV